MSLSPPKPRISSNLDGRRSGPGHAVRNEPDVAAGATSASDKPPATGKKTQSRVKAANEASRATNVPDGVSGCGGKTPTSLAGQSMTSGATSPIRTRSRPPGHSNVKLSTSRRRADSDELVGDASIKCKEARGARNSIIHNEEDNKADEESEVEDNCDEDPDDEDDAELALLRWEMDTLEHHMYSKGTMTLVFACTVTQAPLAGKTFGEDAIAATAAIFDWSENPNPCTVTAAFEPDTASARATSSS